MSDRLDTLLEAAVEPEVFDEAFVMRVMRDVRADEQRRWGRRALRRPMVIGIAAAALVTGGAVAAVVGSNPSTDTDEARPKATTSVTVTDAPRSRVTETKPSADTAGARVGSGKSSSTAAQDALTDHSSFVVDEATGLRLETESYTNAFIVDKPQRITTTLENTGRYPISVSGPRGCTMQVMAVPAGEAASDGLDPSAYGGRFEWACGGSEEDPRIQAADDSFMLAPGERLSADALITIGRAGDWELTGICRCTYRQMKPTPVPDERDALTGLTTRALPSPLLPESSQGENLSTPPIRVRAS